jgi:hypothetical protein
MQIPLRSICTGYFTVVLSSAETNKRMKIKTSFFVGIFLLVAISAHSTNFNYKSVDDFRPLSNFESFESFEKNIQDYIQTCLDRSSGGTDGMPCFISNKIWDRELNIYFNKLAFAACKHKIA